MQILHLLLDRLLYLPLSYLSGRKCYLQSALAVTVLVMFAKPVSMSHLAVPVK